MIANEKPELLEATKSLYHYNNEETIRFQCYAREDYRRQMNSIEKERAEHLSTIAEQEATIAEQGVTIAELSAYIKELEAKLNKTNQ